MSAASLPGGGRPLLPGADRAGRGDQTQHCRPARAGREMSPPCLGQSGPDHHGDGLSSRLSQRTLELQRGRPDCEVPGGGGGGEHPGALCRDERTGGSPHPGPVPAGQLIRNKLKITRKVFSLYYFTKAERKQKWLWQEYKPFWT